MPARYVGALLYSDYRAATVKAETIHWWWQLRVPPLRQVPQVNLQEVISEFL